MSIVMSSDQKIEANRQNALKSTGPKSDAGKERSSQNARKHDIFCKDLIVPGEDPAAFEEFKRDMLRTLNPRNILELQLAEQIIANDWRIKRVRSAERAAFERVQAEDAEQAERRKDAATEMSEIEQGYKGTYHHVPDVVAARYSRLKKFLAEPDQTVLPISSGVAMERLMRNGPELDRLGKYEQRLRNANFRALKEMRQLRAEEPEELSELTAGMLEEVKEQDIVKNEPTEAASDDVKESCGTTEEVSDSGATVGLGTDASNDVSPASDSRRDAA